MNKIYSNQARQIGILKPIANLCNGLSAFSFQLFVLFALALQLLSFRSNAQQYPVQVTPVLLPPYSLRLADYATTTDTKLQLYLLMRDLLEPSHQVRLRFSLESGINASPIAYSTPLVTGFKDVTLYPGTPLALTNVDLRALFDLQNLSGISASDYARPLPQGIYRFSFQAFDAITQRTLSAKSFATAYFVQYDPPRLSLPQQGEKVLKQNEFQRIIFQWMPSQVAPNTKYIFTLKELWDNERDPVAGFLSSRALWQEEVYPNTLLYGIDKTALIPGKRYAWQVQAKSGNLVMGGSPTEDNGVYRNNGLSEIFYFDYVEDCLVPSFLMAKNVGRGRTEIRWNVTGSKPDGLYRIQYRKRGSTGAWEQQESYQEMATITGLEDVTAYEYRVGSVCGNLYQTNASNPATGNDPTDNAYAYSGIQNFTTDARGSQNTNYQCGVMPPVDITNSSPLQTALGVNEVFMAGDFPVTVLEAQGSNGTYSGKGYIQVPYLADTRIKVEFNNIRLNTDMKLIGGVIETSYDPNETSVKFVSDGIGETFGDQGIKEVKVAYTISKIEYVATPPPGKIVVSGNSGTGNANDTGSGTPSQQELPAGKDYAIIDKSGKIWNVDESGAVNEAGQEAKGGTSTAANTQGVTGTGSNTQVSGYTAKGIKIKWQESSLDTTFAFDTEEKTKLGEKGNYPKLKDADGNTVYVPFKAVVNGQTGYLDAKISIGDPNLKDAEVIFKTLKVGKAIDAKLLGKTDTERSYQLTLKGVMDYAEEEVLAVLMPKDSTSKQQVIGSFRLVHLSPKTVKVTLVPTDEASKAKLKAQGEELKRIYGKIGVKIEIKEDPILDISSVVSGNTINSEDAELMSTYSEQQQQINALYKGTADRYVVFVTSKTSSTGQSGYMRLNGQFGYVYQNATGKTTAHELGHGVFKLEHPWKAYGTTKGTTNLLMDYSNGDELSHLEWKQVNDPALKIYSFQGQSSGEELVDGKYYRLEKATTFLSPANKAFELPVDTKIWFYCLDYSRFVNGAIYGFTLPNGEKYYFRTRDFGGTNFSGYYTAQSKPYSSSGKVKEGLRKVTYLHDQILNEETGKHEYWLIEDNWDVKANQIDKKDLSGSTNEGVEYSTSGNIYIKIETNSNCNGNEVQPKEIESDGRYQATITFDKTTRQWKVVVKLDKKLRQHPSLEKLPEFNTAEAFEKQMSGLATEKLNELGGPNGKKTERITEETEDDGEFYVKNMNGSQWVESICDLGTNVWENAALPEGYWNKNKNYAKSPIHIPPTLTGVSNGVIGEVSDYPQLVKLGYDIATKVEVRAGLWNSVKNISASSVKNMANNAIKERIDNYNFSDKPYLGYHQIGKDGATVITLAMGGIFKKGVDGLKNGVEETGKIISKKIDDVLLGGLEGADDVAKKAIKEAIEKGDFGRDVVEEAKDEINDIASSKGKKLTWDEVKVLFKRGNDFNAKGRTKYLLNEVVLGTKKRLDSYIPGKEIISRKATTLSGIEFETFENYLKELTTKYKKGTAINSSKTSGVLSGEYMLEIPTSNKSFAKIAEYEKFAKDNYGITIKYLEE